MLDVNVGGRQEGVDSRSLAVANGLPCTIDVGAVGTSQAADDGALDFSGDLLDRVEVARRGDREAGLDDVDAEARQLLGDLELLGSVQRVPGDCSPSRRVVSNSRTRFGSSGKVDMSFSSVG